VVPRAVLEDLLPGPVTVVSERSVDLNPALNPGTSLVGIRIPDHTLMQRLAQACGGPIALTSANRSAAQSTLTLDVSTWGCFGESNS
jgi:tRNA A37 threonylcarbamoyladenosine synthetase subunit TsaC/SUA5/YrdC